MNYKMRRADREMDKETAWLTLTDADVLRISMIVNKKPYIIPVNFVEVDKVLYFHCALDGKKMEMLNNETVCVEVDNLIAIKHAPKACKFSSYYQSVIAYGAPFEVTDLSVKANILNYLTAKYCDSNFDKVTETQVSKVRVIGIKIKEISGKEKLPK